MKEAPQAWTVPQRRAAILGLTGATFFWGATFFLMKSGTAAIARNLPPGSGHWAEMIFLAVRFVIAAALFPIVFPWIVKGGWKAFRWGALTCIPFAGGFILQNYGLAKVEPSVSALYTSLFVLFTPMIVYCMNRKSPGRNLLVGIACTLAGLWLTTGMSSTGFGWGEFLSLLCAFVFSFHILLTDVGTRRADPIAIAWHCIWLSAVVCAVPVLFASPSPLPGLSAALRERDAIIGLAVTAVLATVGSIALMNHFQRRLSPSRAAVVYTMEPVFAGMFSWVFAGELFSTSKLFGGALVIAGNLIAGLPAGPVNPEAAIPPPPKEVD